MSDEEKVKKAQNVFDSVLNAFPKLRALMFSSQQMAKEKGYVETILGRRRHIPDMMLPEFEFVPTKTYVNPDVDPLDVSTLHLKDKIPDRIVKALTAEFSKFKYFGQIARRSKELYEEGIKVINNRQKITDASRKCVNSIVQGSAADQTKMAILMLENNEEWKQIGGRLLLPVHDELIAEVPIEYAQRGGELLSGLMCEAASFLPFPSKCDVTTTLRWYGLEYPPQYPKPTSVNTEDPEEIKWIQYHLFEMEYILPIIKNPDGSKPRGDAASGINGIRTPEMEEAIKNYLVKNNVGIDKFLDDIEYRIVWCRGIDDPVPAV